MTTKIFISRVNEGWTEVEVPKEFQHYPYERLVLVAHKMLGEKSYKGLLITQNPAPFTAC
jgi:hypothetical protein